MHSSFFFISFLKCTFKGGIYMVLQLRSVFKKIWIPKNWEVIWLYQSKLSKSNVSKLFIDFAKEKVKLWLKWRINLWKCNVWWINFIKENETKILEKLWKMSHEILLTQIDWIESKAWMLHSEWITSQMLEKGEAAKGDFLVWLCAFVHYSVLEGNTVNSLQSPDKSW